MKGPLSGKTVLITGATDGLGKLLARRLAEKGGIILLHGRNPEKGRSVMAELSDSAEVHYFNADYASLEEVKELSKAIINNHDHIDILINNVGIGKGTSNIRELSKDGFELRFAVNFLAHVLLTESLLRAFPDNTSSIINVASVGQEPIDFPNVMLESGYDGFLAYKQSKTALIMYTIELADRLKNKNINVNAIHPASLMNTRMVIDDWGYTLSRVEDGASAVENLLTTEKTGQYFNGKIPSKAISQVYSKEARNKLMSLTMSLLKDFI
jgi:NAD(P)-dependent dehydrogenase (short-subunit alcohol dehydrogenase family)